MLYQSWVSQHEKTNLSVHRHYVLSKILKIWLEIVSNLSCILRKLLLTLVGENSRKVSELGLTGTWERKCNRWFLSDQRDVFMPMWAIILAADCPNPSCVGFPGAFKQRGKRCCKSSGKQGSFCLKKPNIVGKRRRRSSLGRPPWGAFRTQFESSCRFITEFYLCFFPLNDSCIKWYSEIISW